MIPLNAALLIAGFVSLAVLIVIYAFDPFKWNLLKRTPITERIKVTQPIDKSEMEPVILLRKQKNCASLGELIKNEEDIRIVGSTLSNVTSKHYRILKALVQKKASLQFILLEPDCEKNKDTFQELARDKGTEQTGEDICEEARRSLNKLLQLKALAANHEKVEIRVTNIKPLVSLVLVNPYEPTGKIFQTMPPMIGFINDDRLASEFHRCNPIVSEAYESLLGVYARILAASESYRSATAT